MTFPSHAWLSFTRPAVGCKTHNAGRPTALVSSAGENLDLTAAAQENPTPSNNVIGYWFSPSMDFLSRQKIKAATPDQAVGVLQLLHAIWRGPDFTKQKLYRARPIDLGWLVEVEHDFTNYPGRIQEIHPYELLTDNSHTVVQLRQRCYPYRGNARGYTNTVISVYEREIKPIAGVTTPKCCSRN